MTDHDMTDHDMTENEMAGSSDGRFSAAFYSLPNAAQIEALARLAQRALPKWGFPATIEPTLVVERENAVFRIDAGSAGTFALRVHRAGYHSDAQLRSQVLWARTLQRDGVVHTADIVDALDGSPFALVSEPTVPEPRQVSLLRWVDGVALSDLGGGDAALLERLGALMARLHQHSERWSPPTDFDALRWDTDGLVGDDPEWGRFWESEGLDAADRDVMLEFRARARTELDRWGRNPDRFALVHGDFLPENLLVHGDDVTLLDFDDCGFGWFLFDVATALAMPSLRPDFAELRDAFIGGYRQHRAFGADDIAALPLFLAVRAATYVGWVHTRSHTEFAKALGPMIVGAAVGIARDYLSTPA
jgi:Ser/Thr protein kinase RdoA (MazF antagonist)